MRGVQTDIHMTVYTQSMGKTNSSYSDMNKNYMFQGKVIILRTTTTTTTILWTPWTLSGITWVSLYQKGKTNLDLLEQEKVSGTSTQTGNQYHASIPPFSFYRWDA